MIKFYYHPSPNPAKVALFLEEAGLEYEIVPVDTRKGEQHSPAYLAINPNAKTPSIVDGEATIFDSSAILLYLAEKTEALPPREYAQSAGRTAFVAVLRLQRSWSVFRPGLPLQRRGSREDRIRDQSIQFRNAPALEDPRRPAGRAEIRARRRLYDRRHVGLGLELRRALPVGRRDLVEDGQCASGSLTRSTRARPSLASTN